MFTNCIVYRWLIFLSDLCNVRSILDYIVMFKVSFVYHSGQLLSCTLWEDYCLQFLEYLNKCESQGPIIILLTNARIKEAQGIVSCAISPLFCCLNAILCSSSAICKTLPTNHKKLFKSFKITYKLTNPSNPRIQAKVLWFKVPLVWLSLS